MFKTQKFQGSRFIDQNAPRSKIFALVEGQWTDHSDNFLLD